MREAEQEGLNLGFFRVALQVLQPPQTNMDPHIAGFFKDSSLHSAHFQVSCEFGLGYSPPSVDKIRGYMGTLVHDYDLGQFHILSTSGGL